MSTTKTLIPLCLGASGSGAGGQPAVVGLMSAGVPNLGPVDDEVVAASQRSCLQACQIGAGAGLRIQGAPYILSAGNPGKYFLFCSSEP